MAHDLGIAWRQLGTGAELEEMARHYNWPPERYAVLFSSVCQVFVSGSPVPCPALPMTGLWSLMAGAARCGSNDVLPPCLACSLRRQKGLLAQLRQCGTIDELRSLLKRLEGSGELHRLAASLGGAAAAAAAGEPGSAAAGKTTAGARRRRGAAPAPGDADLQPLRGVCTRGKGKPGWEARIHFALDAAGRPSGERMGVCSGPLPEAASLVARMPTQQPPLLAPLLPWLQRRIAAGVVACAHASLLPVRPLPAPAAERATTNRYMGTYSTREEAAVAHDLALAWRQRAAGADMQAARYNFGLAG